MPFPTTSVLDSFGDTEGPPMTGWTTPTGVAGLKSASGVCQANAANAFGIWNSIMGGADEEVFCTVTTATGSGGVVAIFVRAKDVGSAATFDAYGLEITEAATDNWAIRTYTNGVPSTIGASFNQEVSNGDSIGLRIIGSTLTAWYKASAGSWTQLAVRTDTTYSAAGYLAASISTTTGRIDNFGGGEYVAPTMNLDPGSYAVSGAAAQVLRGYALGLEPGAYTLTGYDASLTVTGTGGYTLNLDPGAYTVTGAASGLLVDRLLSLASGAYNLTGQAADLLYGRALNLDAGAYSVTGSILQTLRDYVLSLEPGAYAVTGASAQLIRDYIFALNAGAYTITGQDAALLVDRLLSLAPGSYAIAGPDAALLFDRLIVLEAGGYVLSGADAELTITGVGAYTLNLNPGSYAVTGTDIATLYNRVINADAGAYTVSGTGLGMTAAGVESDFSSGPYPLIIPRRLVETLSNEERARLLTALLVVLE